jgi:nucleotide-binding universal stress UspA family protein
MLVEDNRSDPFAAPPADRPVHRVLVAFDGSAGAWAALAQAIEIARSRRATLTIAAVVDEAPSLCVGLSPIVIPYSREAMCREAEGEMLRVLAAARDSIPADLPVTTRLLHGRPARVLAKLAEDDRCDLVVTGPPGAGRLRALLGGGVTRGLLARCGSSVLAVRAPA